MFDWDRRRGTLNAIHDGLGKLSRLVLPSNDHRLRWANFAIGRIIYRKNVNVQKDCRTYSVALRHVQSYCIISNLSKLQAIKPCLDIMHCSIWHALLVCISAIPSAIAWQPRGGTYARDDLGLVVETTSGEVHGFVNSTTPEVRTWLGIPYAEPPLGYLRFASPVPKSREVDPIYATQWKPSCMQTWSNESTIYTQEVPQFLTSGSSSEDCLYINIWAPKVESLSGGKVPVFVYIPGGGFTGGGAHSYYKIPDKLVQARQDVVFVIMNYRLNVFGYPDANGLDGKNPGILDQRMVIEWTRDNIAAFGGDPELITLWGQSAGGMSVDLYSYAWYKDPILSGLVADSGSVGGGFDPIDHGGNFSYLAGLVGCGGLNDSPSTELTCMQNVPAGTLENVLSSYQASDQQPSVSFGPVADGLHVFANYTERAMTGKVAQTVWPTALSCCCDVY